MEDGPLHIRLRYAVPFECCTQPDQSMQDSLARSVSCRVTWKSWPSIVESHVLCGSEAHDWRSLCTLNEPQQNLHGHFQIDCKMHTMHRAKAQGAVDGCLAAIKRAVQSNLRWCTVVARNSAAAQSEEVSLAPPAEPAISTAIAIIRKLSSGRHCHLCFSCMLALTLTTI